MGSPWYHALVVIVVYFTVGVFSFKRYGSITNWTVVCRMRKDDTKTKESSKFHGFTAEATVQAKVLLSNRQTKDAINSISFACGKNRCTSEALIMTILPDCYLRRHGEGKEVCERHNEMYLRS